MRAGLGFARLATWLLAAVAALALGAEPIEPEVGGRLGEIQRALVELRFEEAVAEAERLLARPDLAEAARVEALILRAQARVALGEWDALEADYKEILALRPAFEPDPRLTPGKARDRFDRVRAAVIGFLELALTPADAAVTVDGRPIEANDQGLVPLLVGEHVLEIAREGYDRAFGTVAVEASGKARFELRLVPNARSVLVFTEPDGVEVALEGVPAGTTRRPAVGGPARLLLENLPLGEHRFVLSKPCHRTEQRQELLLVDLTDNAPHEVGPIRLEPAHATLTASGEPVGATLAAGGRALGQLPFTSRLCPGEHRVEVRHAGRTVWQSDVTLDEGTTTAIEVMPRPNVVIAGADHWPPELERSSSLYNTIAREAPLPPRSAQDLDWKSSGLPQDADLVLARVVAPAAGAAERWVAYSPLLDRDAPLELTRVDPRRPTREVAVWGLETADSSSGGPARIIAVMPRGAAAAAGLEIGGRILEVGGASVERSAQVRGILRSASARRPLALRFSTASGETRDVTLEATVSPHLEPSRGHLVEDVFRAAWAQADAVLADGRGELARATLALLYEAWGRNEASVQTWRRVRLEERSGIGRGTAQYYLGRVLESLGRTEEASAAYREAAASEATAFHDEGPPVAPAARDRLGELASP